MDKSEKLNELIDRYGVDDVISILENKRKEDLKNAYKDEPRRALCVRIKESIYNKISDFCNKKGEYEDVEMMTSMASYIETLTKIFLIDLTTWRESILLFMMVTILVFL